MNALARTEWVTHTDCIIKLVHWLLGVHSGPGTKGVVRASSAVAVASFEELKAVVVGNAIFE